MRMSTILIVSAGALAMTACTTTGNVERGAVKGAAIGAVAGAILGNNSRGGDAEEGAELGAVVGAIAGGALGARQDRIEGEGTRLREGPAGRELYYDERAGRYYFFDESRGRTYWQNGELRG